MTAEIPDLLAPSLHALVELRAKERGAHPFLVFTPPDAPARTLSYAEFARQARALANGLRRRGLQPGDRINVHLNNCPEFLLMLCAASAIGVIVVNTNTSNSPDEQRYCLEKARVRAAVTSQDLAGIFATVDHMLDWMVTIGPGGCFEDLLAGPAPESFPPPDPMAPLCVQFTSGSTSRPKGVIWTNMNAVWAGQISAAHQELRADDVHLCVLPLFHTNALSYSWLASIAAGASFVFMPRFSATRFWAVAVEHGCTWASVTAFCYRALQGRPIPLDHQFRRWGLAFQDPIVTRDFGIPVTSWWGMSETLTQGIVSPPGVTTPAGAVGKVAPEYQIKLLRDDDTAAREGEIGRILIRGTPGVTLFAGYLDDSEATAAAFRPGGWFDTADMVFLLHDGFLRFEGRSRDMLKVSGENVAAAEIERVLAAVPGVAEVAVIGVHDPMRDEVPVAYLRLEPDSREPALAAAIVAQASLQCACELAAFKHPREILVIEDFPRANLGKISKPALQRAYAAAPA